ncbi:type II secretion system protein [Puniceicoccus vermicola]|uniref:Prepilin-type N-terminal cleavage/methylation domain-containing protein n=1 Tax=Puniceicoccus vermicola TaxID=388746 RepID=A0A7X1E593_9BACT|nr:prepilin-type N-terminal cleavage/methylation domain-containing protein [Puniceicoccus vermicola]MBC2603425.1 prepilin-type N-terminal cleavage/methylation domain-containing protein [Puniceicoccus vermicola]
MKPSSSSAPPTDLTPRFSLPGSIKRDSRSGFTLIEILTVIAILGILIAIVTPIVSNSLERSRISKSIANLRQLHQGMSLYVQDSDGFFPEYWDYEDRIGWSEKIWPYIYPEQKFPGYGHVQEGTVFESPLIEDTPLARSYGMNRLLQEQQPNRRYLLNCPTPKTALIMDTKETSAAKLSTINFRNDGKLAVVFLDGHTDLLAKDEIATEEEDVFWSGSEQSK